jgi:hypothetical protein
MSPGTNEPADTVADLLESRTIRWLFVFSCLAMSVLTAKPSIVTMIGSAVVFSAAYCLIFRMGFLGHVFCEFSKRLAGVALVLTIIMVHCFSARIFFIHYPNVFYRLQASAGIPEAFHEALTHALVYLLCSTTAPFLFAFLYILMTRLALPLAGILKPPDRIALSLMTIAVSVLTVILYNKTNCFYGAGVDDVVYTFDSFGYYDQYYYNPSSHLHHALVHVFFSPVAGIARLGSNVLYFIPNIFPVLLCVLQSIVLCISALLLSRILNLKSPDKVLFLVIYALSYPAMLNAITLEANIVSAFWLICFLYFFFSGKSGWSCDLAYIAATGNLAVSGIVVLCHARFRKIVRALFGCVVFMLMFNAAVFDMSGLFLHVRRFSGMSLPLADRLLQFYNFISSCLIKPEISIRPRYLAGQLISYQLSPAESVNIFGVALLALTVLGFALNHRNRFAQFCLSWVALSFFILVVLGWGSLENGFILYSLYFGWAYFCLLFMAIDKLLSGFPAAKYGVYVSAAMMLAAINFPGIHELIRFCVKYYPVT